MARAERLVEQQPHDDEAADQHRRQLAQRATRDLLHGSVASGARVSAESTARM